MRTSICTHLHRKRHHDTNPRHITHQKQLKVPGANALTSNGTEAVTGTGRQGVQEHGNCHMTAIEKQVEQDMKVSLKFIAFGADSPGRHCWQSHATSASSEKWEKQLVCETAGRRKADAYLASDRDHLLHLVVVTSPDSIATHRQDLGRHILLLVEPALGLKVSNLGKTNSGLVLEAGMLQLEFNPHAAQAHVHVAFLQWCTVGSGSCGVRAGLDGVKKPHLAAEVTRLVKRWAMRLDMCRRSARVARRSFLTLRSQVSCNKSDENPCLPACQGQKSTRRHVAFAAGGKMA